MELPIVFALVTSFIVAISSHPRNSDIIPKDYYKRQVLQPIPGYIPVYIKADGEPLVRRESKKPLANVHAQKIAEPKEKNLPEHAEEVPVEKEVEKSGAKPEGGIKTQNPSLEVRKSEEAKPEVHRNENHDAGKAQVGVDAQKTQTVS